MAPNVEHSVTWEENDTPISDRFRDPFFSRNDGRAEAQHVFLMGNSLPQRLVKTEQFTIAELGFGTGLNCLETIATWQTTPHRCHTLTYLAVEAYPLARSDLLRALARWPSLVNLTDILASTWPPSPGWSTIKIGCATVKLCIADISVALSNWPKASSVDAWYFDGFSPSKNPEMWSTEAMTAVWEQTCPGGTFATFTVAGWVRRNLQNAGFVVEKRPGFHNKRECLGGYRPVP
ncbi:MAG: tRNA (5-methylaminomethyl-2-thiouridine)(34)-methyltransferase MnmD [Hyphomicrobiaceae bacterium]